MSSGPELPVIYENPRFDKATPTLKPVIDRAVRFTGVILMEWGTLTLIEDSPRYLKIATIIVAGLVLAVHESWPWLRMRDRRWYPALMTIFISGYFVIFAYALYTEPVHKSSSEEIAAAVIRALPGSPTATSSSQIDVATIKGLETRIEEATQTIRRYKNRFGAIDGVGNVQPRDSFPEGPILTRPLTPTVATKLSDAIDSLRVVTSEIGSLSTIDDILPPDTGGFQANPWFKKLFTDDGIDKTLDRLSEIDSRYQKSIRDLSATIDADKSYSNDLSHIVGIVRLNDMHNCLVRYITVLSALKRAEVTDAEVKNLVLQIPVNTCVEARRDYWRWRNVLGDRLKSAQQETGKYLNAR